MSRNSVLGTAGTVATTSCLPPLLEKWVAQMLLLKQFSHKRLQLSILRETCQC